MVRDSWPGIGHMFWRITGSWLTNPRLMVERDLSCLDSHGPETLVLSVAARLWLGPLPPGLADGEVIPVRPNNQRLEPLVSSVIAKYGLDPCTQELGWCGPSHRTSEGGTKLHKVKGVA